MGANLSTGGKTLELQKQNTNKHLFIIAHFFLVAAYTENSCSNIHCEIDRLYVQF